MIAPLSRHTSYANQEAHPFGWRLSTERVDVWRIRLEVLASQGDTIWKLLSEDEQDRAGRFIVHQARIQFILSRGLLRTVLGRYLGVAPAKLAFSYDPLGKPALAGPAESELRFNLAHSGGLALLAVAWGREVGVDVEQIRPDLPTEQLADRYFTPREAARLRELPPGPCEEAFFRLWTQKEACLKACGAGLALPLDAFELTLFTENLLDPPSAREATREVASFLFEPSSGTPPYQFRGAVQAIQLDRGYCGAVAAAGEDWRLECRSWDLSDCDIVGV